jgi:NADPH:quinone reductase-like Zn-dependent oxidoreductase
MLGTMKANRLHGFGGPEAITFEEAPYPMPDPGQVLVRVHSRGERLLVHGAAGNVGAYAVQLARLAGARVWATAFAEDAEEVLRRGARQVIEVGTALLASTQTEAFHA